MTCLSMGGRNKGRGRQKPRFEALLNYMQRHLNIKLNAVKFRVRQQSVPNIGHILTAEGLKVD